MIFGRFWVLDGIDVVKEQCVVEIMEEMKIEQINRKTYKYGQNRIDAILTTRQTLDYISYAEYLPFDSITFLDHLPIQIHIHKRIFSTNTTNNRTYHFQRNLKLNKPRVITKYNEILEETLTTNKIEMKLKQISHDLQQFGNLPHLMRSYNRIQKQIIELQTNSERKCNKHKHGHPWSPILSKKGKTVSCLSRLMRNYPRHGIPNHHPKHIEISTPNNLLELQFLHREELKKLKQIQKQSHELRQIYLQERAEYYAEINQTKVATILKQIKSSEKSKRLHSKIKFQLHNPEHNEITHLNIKTEDSFQKIYETDAVHKALLKHNREIFSYTGYSPLQKTPILNLSRKLWTTTWH